MGRMLPAKKYPPTHEDKKAQKLIEKIQMKLSAAPQKFAPIRKANQEKMKASASPLIR
jgi:hypothetical protein